MRATSSRWIAACGAVALILGCSRATAPSTGLASLVVSGGNTQIVFVGDNLQLSLVAKDGAGNVMMPVTASWSVNDSTIATVSSAGTVFGLKVGTAYVTARSANIAGTAILEVQARPLPGAASK